MPIKKKPLTVNVTKIPGEGPQPLRIKFDITLAADDPRQETVFPAFGEFLKAVLSEDEAREFLKQFEEKAKGEPICR